MLQILSTAVWALDPKFYGLAKSIILKRIENGDSLDASSLGFTKEDQPVMQFVNATTGEFMAESVGRTSGSGRTLVADTVAIVPLRGAMTKYRGECGRPGTKDVVSWMNQAINDPNVGSIVLLVDSPGGAVDGTDELAMVVKNSPKPVVAFVDGLAASAGYWVASQTSEIFINSATTAWVGSIGVLVMHVDQSQYLEMQGLKATIITADKSTHKVIGNSLEPLSEEALAMFKADLNKIMGTFEERVKTGRGKRLKNDATAFTGAVWNGEEGKALGLVDKIGTLQEAINRAAELARKQSAGSTNSKTKPNSNNEPMKKLSFLTSALIALGFISAPAAGEEAPALEANEETLAQADKAIEAAELRATAAEEKLTTATAEVDQLKTAKADLEKEKGTLTAERDQLANWKAEADKRNGKAADESNQREASQEKPLTEWNAKQQEILNKKKQSKYYK